ncbi:NAD-dependent epimerase/dehydratase family protein [Flavobacterium ardleyense]|uniref:NAD-dependent epimerase/dehydratase family protein n=1 Tax=Flavobacterium ardleyense TaxID=2038737 RepID=A0ABW5Z3A1_9FLAO
MEITITGASGFVGSNISKYLEKQNFTIQPLSLREANWRDKFNVNSEAIIHLAGKAHDTSKTQDIEEYFRINTELTIEIFNLFLKSNNKDFFYFSSVKAVADTIEDVLKEEQDANPLTPYGKSKLKAEQYITSQKLPAGKRVFIIRPCMIHGPGNKGNLNLLYKIVEKGIPWPLTNFENQRSFLSIENLSFLVVNMLKNSNVKSGVYNFADDGSLSTNQLITLINEGLNKKPRFLKWSKKYILKLAKIGDTIHLPLNSENLKKLTENYVVSNKKIKQELSIEKLPITVSEGILQTINSFKNK